ncbi:MAG: DUF1566 domain-containing protein [Gammaproteobacteria bacterium]|nr:MAG: DUF1566 domain-containing protein [Gammaproteobacteria bacterium]
MNISHQTKKHIMIARTLLFSIGIMLSCNIFAGKGPMATQTPLDTEISDRMTVDVDLQDQIDNIPLASIHAIGDLYGGGIVVWVDEGGQRGIIAALADQSTDIQWRNGTTYRVTGATGNGLGAGQMNTAIIVSTQISDAPTADFAAKIAADYSVQEDGETACTGSASETCHGDWYLPSKFVLNLMYENLHLSGMGDFADDVYWSSTEISNTSAWIQSFFGGTPLSSAKYNPHRVRAARAFNN